MAKPEGRISVDNEIKTAMQPWTVRAVLFCLKIWFSIYDIIAFIPFQVFANPQEKLDRSQRVKVNFVFCQLISLPIAGFYYRFLPANHASKTVRLLVPFGVGLFFCLFCFGTATKHILADTLINYLITRLAPPKYVHKLVFVIAMGYLSFIHIYRAYFTGDIYLIDVTGPMMVVTQKVTSLAFSLHDGIVKEEQELTEIQKRELIKDYPSVLEYFSYIFQFQSILCGPLCFFSDYISFIEGRHIETMLKTQNPELLEVNGNRNIVNPSPFRIVIEKVCISIFFMLIAGFVAPSWPADGVLEKTLSDGSFLLRFSYIVAAMTLIRAQYYYAWVLADAVSNASGFGFNGYTADGKAKWDLVSNVKIWNHEAAGSFREALDGWNCTTMHWLRRVGYERSPKGFKTVFTYILSAWWHGFFPGYYMTFLGAALFTEAARWVRRCCRPYVVESRWKKFCYDCLTMLGTKATVSYVTFPFVLRHFWAPFLIYRNFYFSLHIGAALVIFLLPRVIPKKKLEEKKNE